MSYDVYWVKNRAEKIADFEHPTLQDTALIGVWRFCYGWLRGYGGTP